MKNLKKINIFIFVFLVLFNLKSYAEVVNKIIVNGNERISSETVVIFGDILIGKNYEKSDVSLIIKKLYETTFFSNISANLSNNILTIEVTENPIVNTINIR